MKKTLQILPIIVGVVFLSMAALLLGNASEKKPRYIAADENSKCISLWVRTVDGSTGTFTITTLGNVTNTTIEVKHHLESWYRDRLAKQYDGQTEAQCYMGRVDVETNRSVYEVDKLEKHHEALGQALWYSWSTKKRPVMALIVPPGYWRKFSAVKLFVESNSVVRVIALDEQTGNVMADYGGGK